MDGRDGAGAERIRDCLDAVLQQTQGAGPSTTHVTVPIAVMDDVARVLQAASPGGDAADLAREVAELRGALETERRRTDRMAASRQDWRHRAEVVQRRLERVVRIARGWRSLAQGWKREARGYEAMCEHLADLAHVDCNPDHTWRTRAVAAERERDKAVVRAEEAEAQQMALEERLNLAHEQIAIAQGLMPVQTPAPVARKFPSTADAALSPRPSGADPGRGTGDASKGEGGRDGT